MTSSTTITQVYPIKLPQEDKLRAHVDFLKQITMEAGQQLLERLWSEEWLDKIATGDGHKKAYCSTRGSSSYCPRCGQKGLKIVDPYSNVVSPQGRFFSCAFCSFSADRDYIASLNIYRMYENCRKKRYTLCFANPVSYMGVGLLRDRPRGAAISLLRGS